MIEKKTKVEDHFFSFWVLNDNSIGIIRLYVSCKQCIIVLKQINLVRWRLDPANYKSFPMIHNDELFELNPLLGLWPKQRGGGC